MPMRSVKKITGDVMARISRKTSIPDIVVLQIHRDALVALGWIGCRSSNASPVEVELWGFM
jgi:hypothetical protein